LQLAVGERRHIPRNHSDAMRIVSGQIRRHQMIRDQFGFARRAARPLPDRPDVCMHLAGRSPGRGG
jgi:hypothetical protein